MKHFEPLVKNAKAIAFGLVLSFLSLMLWPVSSCAPVNPVPLPAAGPVGAANADLGGRQTDLTISIGGKKWDGKSDLSSNRYKVTGE